MTSSVSSETLSLEPLAPPLVELRNISKSFGSQKVLDDISLKIYPGEAIVIIGPSGTGKSTLCARLLGEIPELMLSISTTTRAPRGIEKHGISYFFTAKEDFQAKIADNRFAEWAEVHGNCYGTSHAEIERARAVPALRVPRRE